MRNENLKTDFRKNENVIVSGSLCTWSTFWDNAFDLGVFLRVPKDIRMKRLLNREIERYGEALNTNEKIKATSKEFLEWAATYDDQLGDGASIHQHKNWIEKMDCPVIEVTGDLTNKERLRIILEKINSVKQ